MVNILYLVYVSAKQELTANIICTGAEPMNETPIFELRKFVVPEIIFGVGARKEVGRYVANYGSKRPMVVTDKTVEQQPWFSDIINSIKDNNYDFIVFNQVSSNPRDFEAMAGAESFLENNCDLIIAVGGGSPMDCAKCISIVASNGGNILDYEGVDEIRLPGPPLICIPSTAGSSADVSQFSIILDSALLSKKAIISKKTVPDLALIDPANLMTMDNYLTACTGMDAMTHAIEAFVSNAHSPLTDVHALQAIKLINENIEEAVSDNRTINTMMQMMLGSLHAGLAFSNASLGAVHAMAHSLGGLFDLPHGECNGILLEHVIELNFDYAADRYIQIAKQLNIDCDKTHEAAVKENLIKKIQTIRDSLGIKSFIEVVNINDSVLENLVNNAVHDPCIITNPRDIDRAEVKEIYERILKIK